jgi:DNA invertase Pin-like site-specific DNA recombinase
MRIATYLRVSTKSQDVEPQRVRLEAFAADRGWTVGGEFVDIASGRQDSRAHLQAMMRAARRGEFQGVLCIRLDRLARSTRHLCQIAEELEAAGVALVAADQHFDTTTAAGKLLYGVLATVAQFEADLIRERTLDGLAIARRKGVRIGRPPALARDQLARARRLRDSGRTLREIADLLDVAPSTVHAALRERVRL